MKIVLLAAFTILTLCGKSQLSTWKINDTTFEKKLLKVVFEHRNQKLIIAYQDSIIKAQADQLTLTGLEIESLTMSNHILELDSDQKTQVIAHAYTDNEQLKSDKYTLERKLKRQKRLKWVFGGVGLALGIVVPILI